MEEDFPDFDWPVRQAALLRDNQLKDNLRESQSNYVKRRKINLARGTKHDLNVDANQLLGIAQIGATWIPTHTAAQYSPMTAVLDEIFRIIKPRYSDALIEAADRESRDPDWLNSDNYRGLRIDRPQYGSGQDSNHPECRIWCLKQLALESTNTGNDANHDSWQKLLYAFEFHAHLFRLKRFADKRNPETSVKPLPDGTNLTDPSLRISWVLYRAFVRALHYRSLKIGPDGFGFSQLQDITTLALLLHYMEVEHIRPNSRDIPHYFQPIVNTYDALQNKLQAVADWVFTEDRPMVTPPWNPEETMKNKLLNSGEFGRLIDRVLIRGPENYEWAFWSLLFDKAEKLERQLAVEHVEDVLIEKRIVVEDEEWQVYETLIQHGVNYSTRNMQDLELPDQEVVTPRLRRIGQINRLRRNHLLLKDWNHRRPYYQLYYVFDTSDNGHYSQYRQTIASWYAHLEALKSHPQPGIEANSPSRAENIWAGMFPLHPLATHSQLDPSKPQPELPNYDNGCIICIEEYKRSETIARLHCGHLFHLACIRSSWDHDRRYKSDCPLCRHNWRLDETVGIKPEVQDVWDNERLLTAQELSTRRDIGDLYRFMEHNTLEASRDWVSAYEPRNALMELAHVRRKRNARNVARRRDIKVAGLGIQVPD